jgi:hypothetical protein
MRCDVHICLRARNGGVYSTVAVGIPSSLDWVAHFLCFGSMVFAWFWILLTFLTYTHFLRLFHMRAHRSL